MLPVKNGRVIVLIGVFFILKTKSFIFVSASPGFPPIQQNDNSSANRDANEQPGGDERVPVPQTPETATADDTVTDNGPTRPLTNNTQSHPDQDGNEGQEPNNEVAEAIGGLQLGVTNTADDDYHILPSNDIYIVIHGRSTDVYRRWISSTSYHSRDGSWDYARQLESENRLNSYCSLFHLIMQYGILYVNDACVLTVSLELGDADIGTSIIISAEVVRYSTSSSNFVYITKGVSPQSVFVVYRHAVREDLYVLGGLVSNIPLPTPQHQNENEVDDI